MKKILLIHPICRHYRIPILNYLSKKFKENGYEFCVVTKEDAEDYPYDIKFKRMSCNLNIQKIVKILKKFNPDILISFINPRNYYFHFIIFYCKINNIKYIYWGHGINLSRKKSIIRNMNYRFIHKLADAIILYSKNEKKYIDSSNWNKTFVANNTLNFDVFPKIDESKEDLKKKYNIKTNKNILFVGRVEPRKKLNLLIDAFKKLENDNFGLLIVGEPLSDGTYKKIKNDKRIKYFGGIYEPKKISEIFKLSDVFSIPGHIGLGLVQAFYWGLPAVTMDACHAPEIFYLENGVNGFIVEKNNISALKNKLKLLLENDELYKEFSKNAKGTIRKRAMPEHMFKGFFDAVRYVENK